MSGSQPEDRGSSALGGTGLPRKNPTNFHETPDFPGFFAFGLACAANSRKPILAGTGAADTQDRRSTLSSSDARYPPKRLSSCRSSPSDSVPDLISLL